MSGSTQAAYEELIRAAGEIVQEIVRVFKTRRLYAPDHPKRQEVEGGSIDLIRNLVDEVGPIALSISEKALSIEEEPVYRQEVGRESIAFLMFREGLRELILHPGIEDDEITGLLDEVAISASVLEEEGEKDLLARLWERDFIHLRYYFVETLAEEEWVPPVEREEEEDEGDRGPIELSEEDRSAAERLSVLEKFDSALYILDDEDMATLQAELESERGAVLVRQAVTLMRELLWNPVRDDPSIVMGAVRDVQRSLVESGDFDEIRDLHEVFSPLLESDAATPPIRETFDELRAEATSEETLSRLGRGLEAGNISDESAAEYYGTFGRGDLTRVLRGAGDIKRLCQRPAIAGVLLALIREDPHALGEALRGGGITASRAAHLASMATDPRLLDALGEALGSDRAEVRREALVALKAFGSGRALEHVSRAVEDPDPAIRLYALRHLVTHRYEPALPRVRAILEQGDLEERSLAERRLLFEAYGALGEEGVVDELARRLRRRGLFRKPDPETVACVLVGLGATGAPEARELVEQRLDSSQALVGRTARKVLEEWGRSPGWTS